MDWVQFCHGKSIKINGLLGEQVVAKVYGWVFEVSVTNQMPASRS